MSTASIGHPKDTVKRDLRQVVGQFRVNSLFPLPPGAGGEGQIEPGRTMTVERFPYADLKTAIGSASWIDHTLNVNVKLTHDRTRTQDYLPYFDARFQQIQCRFGKSPHVGLAVGLRPSPR